VDPQALSALEPLSLDPVVTAPLIFLGDWSPGGAFLPVYTFTADQVAELDLAPEGPLAYPPVGLRVLEASSGQVCDYPRLALVGAEALAWLPDGAVAVREASGWWSGLPCSADFQPVADPHSLAPYFSDPGLSPDGRYRASRFFDVREGIVYNETTLTGVDSGEALQTIAWQQEERLGDWAEAGPGGRWLDSRYFLIPKTSDQGPLLVEANQRIIPVLSEFFGESFTPCTPRLVASTGRMRWLTRLRRCTCCCRPAISNLASTACACTMGKTVRSKRCRWLIPGYSPSHRQGIG